MTDLHIITPVSRQENLDIISCSLDSIKNFEILWSCIGDINYVKTIKQYKYLRYTAMRIGDGFAGSLRNVALDAIITDGWVYCLDDDNIIHPDFDETLSKAILDYPDANGFVFDQILPDGSIRKVDDPYTTPLATIDMGQFILTRNIIGDTRFVPNIYIEDFLIFDEVRKKPQAKIYTIHKAVTYYNYLRKYQ